MKIWLRFVLNSSLSLLFFCVYCLAALPFFLHAVMPEGSWETSLVLDTPETPPARP